MANNALGAKSSPLVSIVILNWNGLDDTKICLEHVQKIDYPNYEVIVVDNGSSQEQKDYLSQLPGITLIDNPVNRGFAGGQADGYRRAKGEFILLLNNDAVIAPNYLKEAVPHFEDSSVAAVGGRSYFWNENEALLDTDNHFYAYMNIDPVTAETTLLMNDRGTVQEVNVVSGSAVVVRKSVAEAVGYLWEPFFAYYEETDLFARYKRAGYKILYSPNLHIWHKNGASSGAQEGSLFFYYHIFRNRYIFAARNFDDEYFKQFKKSYYRLARQAIASGASGASQRRLAKAYVKAISYVRRHQKDIAHDRKQLKAQLPSSLYSKKIIEEQIEVSFVIDASDASKKEVSDLYKNLSADANPLHEYIIVTPHAITPARLVRNVRFVVSKQLFSVHPINLGCLAAQYDWMMLCTVSSWSSRRKALSLLVDNHQAQPSVITVSSTALLMTKQIFERIGGLHTSETSLAKNITAVKQYAHVAGELVTSKPVSIDTKTQEALLAQIKVDTSLFSLQHTSKWQKLLSRYYRLQQLNSLALWSIHPSISPRLKLGRTKNIIISGVTFNKNRLALELKHIRNEVFQQSTEKKALQSTLLLQKKAAIFLSKQLTNVEDIPVFIVCFERVRELSRLVKKLEKLGLKKIVFIDNDSTYKPLLDYYKKSPHQVLRLHRNIGHTAPWSLGIIRTLIPYGYYIVTDPDVIPTDACLKNAPLQQLLSLHKKYPSYQKVGLGLKIDDLPRHYPLKKEVSSWEQQFWKNEVEPAVYEAGVDTTFALYKPATYTYLLHPSLRTGEPYTARHMPWYMNPATPTQEDLYYKMRASSTITSWNVDELPERYKKEMERV
jgi:GT2 family glycosyltransferase